ncbi:hypothetical protein ACQP1U_12495 [Actinomycetota bacterium]
MQLEGVVIELADTGWRNLDLLFDNFLVDLAMSRRIEQAIRSANAAREAVHGSLDRLTEMRAALPPTGIAPA